MSYKILYDGKTPVANVYRPRSNAVAIICIVLTGLVAAKLFYPDFDHVLQQMIFPGSGEDTLMLLEQTIADIRGGEAIGHALHTFCSEVIANAAY